MLHFATIAIFPVMKSLFVVISGDVITSQNRARASQSVTRTYTLQYSQTSDVFS